MKKEKIKSDRQIKKERKREACARVYVVKEYIYYYIKENNINKREFCKRCKIKPKILRMIARRNYNLSVDILLKISNFIGVPIYKFMIQLDKKAREQEYFLIK